LAEPGATFGRVAHACARTRPPYPGAAIDRAAVELGLDLRSARVSYAADVIEPARSFDRAAADYERVRPGYPAALLEQLPVARDAEVLDLGAGTGKLTRVLAARYRHVTAVEPLDGMRAILEQVVPAAAALAGSAEEIPLPEGSVDAVFAGQAFHWFANDAAVAEIGRVLRPAGVVALVWNEPVDPTPLPQSYYDYLESFHAPVHAALQKAEPWRELLERGPFHDVRQDAVEHEQVQERESVLAGAQTFSWIAYRPDDQRAAIARRLDELLSEGPFTFRMRANVMWAVRA
jgi:ubiquinone/menaquinone biosynthesis C-methylase UbiE